jgi:hypothetical protein
MFARGMRGPRAMRPAQGVANQVGVAVVDNPPGALQRDHGKGEQIPEA